MKRILCVWIALAAGMLARGTGFQPAILFYFGLEGRATAGEPAQARGKLDAVTVYRGQALVTRLVDLPAGVGLREIVVTDLPARVVPGSIYAESANGVEVRSVLYRDRPVGQDVREEVKKLDLQIRETQDKIAANQRFIELAGERKAFMGKLEQFVAPTSFVEMSKGVLNAEVLKSVTLFQFDQRQKLAEEELKLQTEQRNLKEQVELLNRQRSEVTGGSAKTVREAVVFANLKEEGGKLRLRYLVDQATWLPSYNIRADAAREKLIVEYNASIQQMSGEDWTGVLMTLSTATPSMVARAPALTPMHIALAPGQQMREQSLAAADEEYGRQRSALKSSQKDAFDNRSKEGQDVKWQWANPHVAGNIGGNVGGFQEAADASLNCIAGELQLLDLVTRANPRLSARGRLGSIESVSVTYDLTERTSLASRADQQLIQIAALPMKGTFYKVATPVLTNYVYEEATVVNEGKLVLLAGPASTFVAGQFVGLGEIPTVAIGESFTIGFGIDSSLRAERELVEKSESIQGGNRVLKFTYRLQIENFGAQAADVRVIDRLPTAKEGEAKVTLAEPGPELSKDALYEKNEKKKGILRWESKIPAQAIGPTALAIQYTFLLEYDKQMGIAGLPAVKK